MLGIILIILVVRMFTRKAGEKGFNKVLWGFIGALSYIILLVIVELILIEMIKSGSISVSTEIAARLIVSLGGMLGGAIGSIPAYQILKKMEPVNANDQIIDNNIN